MKTKIMTLIISLSLAVSSVTAVTPEKYMQAATKKAQALKAYRKVLKGNKIHIGDGMGNCKLNKNIFFEISDLNHDGVPELILYTERNMGESCMEVVYTYYKGKVSYVTYASHGGVGGYKKGSVFTTDYTHGKYACWRCHYIIENGKGKVLAQTIEEMNIDASEKYTYYIGDKKVSKKKYNAYIKKLTKGSKVDNSGTSYPVTRKNINKYLK